MELIKPFLWLTKFIQCCKDGDGTYQLWVLQDFHIENPIFYILFAGLYKLWS